MSGLLVVVAVFVVPLGFTFAWCLCVAAGWADDEAGDR